MTKEDIGQIAALLQEQTATVLIDEKIKASEERLDGRIQAAGTRINI